MLAMQLLAYQEVLCCYAVAQHSNASRVHLYFQTRSAAYIFVSNFVKWLGNQLFLTDEQRGVVVLSRYAWLNFKRYGGHSSNYATKLFCGGAYLQADNNET